MKVIVGLGNPGAKYKFTRHNIGFILTGELSSKYFINGRFEAKFNAQVGKGLIKNQEVMIIQPMTYMNLSGESVVKVLNFYKIEPAELIVVFDDISLDLGKIRFRSSGSDGGHNGIKSIIKNLGGYNKFARLKLGIGPQPPKMPSEDFVLQKFADSEKDVLNKVISTSVEAVECYLDEGLEKAMNLYNGVNLASNP